jgi:carboxymethylenebutenolidase
VSQLAHHFLAIFGKSDPSIPEQQIEAFRKGLKKAKVKHEILLYEAGHAFANPSSGRYVAEAAGKAWIQVRKFFISELQTGEKPAEQAPPDE